MGALRRRGFELAKQLRQGRRLPQVFQGRGGDLGFIEFLPPSDNFVGRRIATENLEIAGTRIAAGDQVTVSLASANRDPERFADPNTFDISRSDANRHVAFGKGIHVCLGAPLARVEGQIAFETLIRRYPELRLAVPEDEVVWSGNFLRGFRQVPLLF